MSALGQKQTYALQQGMSALHPIATAKAKFRKTVWPEFRGYQGVALTRLWPPTGFDIDTDALPDLSDEAGVLLHETISREGKRPP